MLGSVYTGVGPRFFFISLLNLNSQYFTAWLWVLGRLVNLFHENNDKYWLTLRFNIIIRWLNFSEHLSVNFATFSCALPVTEQYSLDDLGLAERIRSQTNITFLLMFLRRSIVRRGILIGSRSRLDTRRCSWIGFKLTLESSVDSSFDIA